MKNKWIMFLAALSFTMPSQAQVLQTEQVTLGGKKYTVVWYSFKCFVEKGEGTTVRFYDAGGNPVIEVCRTGGGGEPALYTFSDGSVKPAMF